MCSYQRNIISLAITALLVMCWSGSGQDRPASVRDLIASKASLSGDESQQLANGETVVKILPSRDKREIAVVGIVKVPSARNVDMATFRESLSQRENAVAINGGRFNIPPSVTDLAGFELGERDLADMQQCVAGKCGVKLSAEMIAALQSVDWNSADSKEKASQVYKRLLIELVNAYLTKGDSGLSDHVDHRQPVRTSNENRLVLESSIFIRSLAPTLDEYLRKYPHSVLPDIEDRLDWTNVSSGLKPILTLTHTTSYGFVSPRHSTLIITTKQIYASHYVDASLAVSSLVRDIAADPGENYLVFTNVSRSDALGGALGGIARSIAAGEAVRKVTDLLGRARVRLESQSRPQRRIDEPETDRLEHAFRWAESMLIPAVVIVIAILSLLLYLRRSHASQ